MRKPPLNGSAPEAFNDKLTALNQRIRDYNLQVPHMRASSARLLNYEQELEKITIWINFRLL